MTQAHDFSVSATADVTLVWRGGRASWAIRRALADAMEGEMEKVVKHAKKLVATPYPPASSPGEPPHRRTGNLQAEIDYWINRKKLQASAGPSVAAEYGWYLEQGTSRMDPRPWLAPTVEKLKAGMLRRLGRKSKQLMKGYRI